MILKKISNYFSDWSICYILILVISGISSFVVQMIATGLPLYCVDIGKTTAESGIMAGFYTVALIISRPFTGKWTDEKGKWLISFIGMILMILSVVGMVFPPDFKAFVVCQTIEGFAYSALSTALAALVVDILTPTTIVKGIALFTISKSLTISLGASFAVSFAEKFGSEKIFLCCLLLMILALILLLLIKKKTSFENKPNIKNIQENNNESFIHKYIETSALTICFIQFLFTFSLTLGTCYLPAYAQSINIVGIGIYYTISALLMLASRTILASFLDSINNKYSYIIGMFLAFITTIAVVFVDKLIYFCIISVFNAIGICMINPRLNVMATANVPINRRGVASSTYYGMLDLGSGAGSMIWGILIPIIGYTNSFISASIILLITLIFGKAIITRENANEIK